jgi:hypothetical protein
VRNREGHVLTDFERTIPLVELQGASDKKPYVVVCAPDADMINDFTKDVWDGKIDEVCSLTLFYFLFYFLFLICLFACLFVCLSFFNFDFEIVIFTFTW